MRRPTPRNSQRARPLAALPAALAGLPLPRRDVATTTEDIPLTIDVLANDRDPNNDPLTLAAVGKPSTGTAQIVNNKILYTPALNFSGSVSFFYSLHDGNPDNTVQSNVSVQVTPVNDAPSDILLSPSSIAENLPASSPVGTLTAVDVDDSSNFDFSLTGTGNDNAFFQIVGAEGRTRLWTLASFDFETKASYTIGVRVRDRNGAAFDKNLAIAVVNANDAPTAINLSNNRIDENQGAGATVGTFSSVDSDAGDAHTYALVGGTGSDDNGSFRLEGATLKTNVLLDYEAKPIYSIRVRSSDNAGAGREQIFLVYLNNLRHPARCARQYAGQLLGQSDHADRRQRRRRCQAGLGQDRKRRRQQQDGGQLHGRRQDDDHHQRQHSQQSRLQRRCERAQPVRQRKHNPRF